MHNALRTTLSTLVLALVAAGSAQADTLTVMWDSNAETVSGYAVYSGTAPGAYSQRNDVGNTTSFTMANAVAGQRYCFAVAAYVDPAAEGPRSAEVCGYSNQAPTLAAPGNQSSTVGQPVSLQLLGSDPDGQPVSYSATGLPPGVTLMSSTGFISGSGTTAGTYAVNAQVSDGVLAASRSFTWTMAAAPAPDTTAPVVTIAAPTSAATFATALATLALGGTATDSAGVTRVDWASDRGPSGTATGTTNWSVPSVALQAGVNVLTVSGRDPSGNVGTKVLTVTYTPPDTTAPSISINSPTTADRYDHLFATVMLAGVAADNVAVTSVTWVNSRGGSGTASGTTNWSVASIALQPGDNVITVTARDAAGNQRTDVLTVAYAVPDTSDPNVSIIDPTSQESYTTEVEVVSLRGVADDNVGVVDVTWTNSRGGGGTASGTANWSVPAVALQQGTNVITVTARDAAGNRRDKSLTIEIAPPPSITLTARLDSSKRWNRVQLAWNVTSTRDIVVYGDGQLLTQIRNDGSYTDSPGRGSGAQTYQVCLLGTTVCSNSATVR